MNKQALTEALARWDEDGALVGDDVFDAFEAAARLVERLLPGECKVCKDGKVATIYNQHPQWMPCPVCHGDGQVWDEGMLEQIMEAASFRSRDIVIAVLSALVELLTEKSDEAGSQ